MYAPGRVGVFGGTFDPIHVGHLIVADVLRSALKLSEVRFLPAGRPPHKPDQQLSSDHDRVAMLGLALQDCPRFTISTMEIERAGPSYTADTVQSIRRDLSPESELYFLMGQDSLRDLPTWHQPWRIVDHARIGVALRPGVDVVLTDVFEAMPSARGRIDLVSVPLIGISSSDIRKAVASGGPIRFQVPPAVADYIQAHGLYLQYAATTPSG
ncbi:MAG TPA: nicotinate-nucleotide adenylyltransferase [Thermomicrobiales bacterium]|nr:nicotinate-nucleotide adenylyltransferase [Thermomicrobiales bacterium]